MLSSSKAARATRPSADHGCVLGQVDGVHGVVGAAHGPHVSSVLGVAVRAVRVRLNRMMSEYLYTLRAPVGGWMACRRMVLVIDVYEYN